MPRYTVNATLNVPAWISVEADSKTEAASIAETSGAHFFDYDLGSAWVEFNVVPIVEEEDE